MAKFNLSKLDNEDWKKLAKVAVSLGISVFALIGMIRNGKGKAGELSEQFSELSSVIGKVFT